MSIDAGGLAQMTYQTPFNNSSIGVSGPGYASRGKGSHIKRLSVAPPSKISTIDENSQINAAATPRTSRGHLLAGLRTAPKSATVGPAHNGLESSKYADPQYHPGNRAPQTTTSAYFPNTRNGNGSFQGFAQTEQILAPPTIDWNSQNADSIDQDLYDELVATNNFLAQQQRALQQQLLSITQTAQQFGNLNINTSFPNNGQQYQSPSTPMSLYQQQCQQGLQPIVQPVSGSPGVFAVYNPMTGQSSYVRDNSAQHAANGVQEQYTPLSPQAAPSFHRQQSDPLVPRIDTRSISPPKRSASPQKDVVEPLPPPSANAFRRGHRKNLSSATSIKTAGD